MELIVQMIRDTIAQNEEMVHALSVCFEADNDPKLLEASAALKLANEKLKELENN